MEEAEVKFVVRFDKSRGWGIQSEVFPIFILVSLTSENLPQLKITLSN